MAALRRLEVLSGHLTPTYWGRRAPEALAYRQACLRLREELRTFINEENCAPIIVRLAWHDSGTFDAGILVWPACGGANGSIRFAEELGHGANAGLSKAVKFLQEFKERYSVVSWADLIQLASAVAIECTGGPRIPMRVGRLDIASANECPAEGNLPDAKPPFGDEAPDAPTHVRNVFSRMGFDDRDIVALLGAHTLGRAFAERSGVTEHNQTGGGSTVFTGKTACPRADGTNGVGMPGGESWCKNWLAFDNEYYKYLERGPQRGLLWLPTDAAMHEDPQFRVHFERYARDQAAFFADYAVAHARLSELGSKFDPPEGIVL